MWISPRAIQTFINYINAILACMTFNMGQGTWGCRVRDRSPLPWLHIMDIQQQLLFMCCVAFGENCCFFRHMEIKIEMLRTEMSRGSQGNKELCGKLMSASILSTGNSNVSYRNDVLPCNTSSVLLIPSLYSYIYIESKRTSRNNICSLLRNEQYFESLSYILRKKIKWHLV